jgi:hypothetical protein
MGLGAQLRAITEYYTHKKVNKRVSDAELSLENAKIVAEETRANVIEPARRYHQENNFRKIITDSLLVGHGNNN